jgi:hypothetical protein
MRATSQGLGDRPLDATVPRELLPHAGEVRPMLARASVSSLHAGLWSSAAQLLIGGSFRQSGSPIDV